MRDEDEDVRREFARRVASLRVQKGWNQSELARQCAKYMSNKKFGRDLISNDEAGRRIPSGVKLNALARSLDVAPEELLIGGSSRAPAAPPAFSLRDTDDGRMFLRVNMTVDRKIGLEILSLLTKEKDA